MNLLTFKSLRTRLTFWFLVLTLTPLFTVLTVTYFQRVKAIKTETFNKLAAIRDLKVARLNDWLSERVGDMKTISFENELTSLDSIINYDITNDQKVENTFNNIRQKLTSYLDNYPVYNEIFIINPKNGKILVASNKYLEGEDRSTNDYFKKPMQSRELSIKDIYRSRAISDYSMVYSIPIFCSDHDGEHIVGILVARIDLHNSLFNMLSERFGLGETGETLIVNKEVVALNELRYFDNSLINLKLTADPAVKAAAGETGIVKTTDYRGKEVLAAFTYIPEIGWGFVSKQDLHETNAPIREMIFNFILIFFIAGFGVSMVSIRLGITISKPIIRMNQVSHRVEEGDYSIRNKPTTKDELGLLALSINKMIDATSSRMIVQTGVANISETMISVSSLEEFGSALLKRLKDITRADMSTFYVLNEVTSEYEHFASLGANHELRKSFDAENPEGEFGNVLTSKRIYYLRNIPKDTIFKYCSIAGDVIPKEIITIPILIDGTVGALISLVNIQTFSKESYDIIELSWTGINTSYSNLIASERTSVLAEQLYRTNQELETKSVELQAQAEELQTNSEELQEQNLIIDAKNKEVEGANKLKSEFLSNMSHELRTPLNSILSLTHVLSMQAKGKLSDKEYSYLEIIERNGKNLLKLVNDILDLSRIEADKLDIFPAPVSIRSLLLLTSENFSQLAKDKGLELILDIPKSLPTIETDESRIQQVLINIVGNSMKFTEKGSIKISCVYENGLFSISITDTGIGIKESELRFIFDEFRQSDGSTSRRFEGTGLGLSIVKKLVNILAGKINISSEVGIGTTVNLQFPEKWMGEKPIPFIASDSTTFRSNGGNKILIVEDNEEAIIQIKSLLENQGLSVDVASGGREALEKVKESKPDGIIVDLMMPDIDGFEVIETIRSTKETAKIPIIVLTAKDLSKKELKILSYNNIQQLIQKGDIDVEGLISKVQLLLRDDSKLGITKSAKKPFVLIVEDNPDDLVSIKAILGEQFVVAEALDGEKGFQMIREQNPDIVLLDISLPKIDGFEVLKLMKEGEDTASIPVIAVTAKAMKEEIESILKHGFNEFVSKPIDHEELLSKIQRLV